MSTELTITKEAAAQAFKNADKKGQKLLTDLFGEKNLSLEITDRVKTLEDALEIAGEDAQGNIKLLLDYNGSNKDMIAASAFAKLTLIARVLNEGWVPDWSNSNQYKYYPYFKTKEAGFGFSGADCDSWCTGTTVGSRLCFKTSELAMYAGKQFETIYNEFLTL